MRVKRDWWKDFFNDIYLITDSRSVCNPRLTCREVDLLEQVLRLNKKDKIFDLCGGYGRHSLELAKRGYEHLTVLDYSTHLIRLGRRLAKEAGLRIKFLCGDARNSRLKKASYSVIFVMANSFGYFPQQRENLRILREMHRLLQRGGRILLDLTDPDYARRHLRPISWHQANKDIAVYRERQLQGDMIKAREIVVSKKAGLLRDGRYCERLYNQEKICRLLENTGFQNLSIKKNLSLHKKKKDYGLMTARMLVSAEK